MHCYNSEKFRYFVVLCSKEGGERNHTKVYGWFLGQYDWHNNPPLIYNLVGNSLTRFILLSSLLQTYVNLEIYDSKNYINFDMIMDKEWWKLFNSFQLKLGDIGSIQQHEAHLRLNYLSSNEM